MIRLNEKQGRWLGELLGRAGSPPVSRDAELALELAQIISQQINTPSHFDDLVDTIIRVIQEPHINNLSRTALDILRNAVLSPLELAKFNTMLGRLQNCSRCGMRLQNYEAVTILNKMVMCHNCAHAEYVTCPTCEALVDVSGVARTIQRVLQRHSCIFERTAGPRPQARSPGTAPSPVDEDSDAILQESRPSGPSSSAPARSRPTVGPRLVWRPGTITATNPGFSAIEEILPFQSADQQQLDPDVPEAGDNNG